MARFGKTPLRAKGVPPPFFFDVANLRPNLMASYFVEEPPTPALRAPPQELLCREARLPFLGA